MDTIKTDIVVKNPIYKAAIANLKSDIKSGAEMASFGRMTGRSALEHARKEPPFQGPWYQDPIRKVYFTCRDELAKRAPRRRYSLLAYAFLRGKTYRQAEPDTLALRDGFFSHAMFLREYKQRLVNDIASLIPADLGDGTTAKDTLEHITMWLDVGHVTRDQILADHANIEATRAVLVAIGDAKGALQKWDAMTARLTRDRDHAASKGWPTTRYELDLTYVAGQKAKTLATLETLGVAV